ncbi:TPA: hypothetical protein N0F65_011336 [Lagenidium giganteum]|uniref:Armadillo repeat-containing protein 8 n=1 Tax=Lagenidium giganteum TaxID=4803 RepID=A0AAV2YJJ0_9STRA|nr:TPA: hypothetical protein N0F65_011336 [Lagenidium giganteum]
MSNNASAPPAAVTPVAAGGAATTPVKATAMDRASSRRRSVARMKTLLKMDADAAAAAAAGELVGSTITAGPPPSQLQQRKSSLSRLALAIEAQAQVEKPPLVQRPSTAAHVRSRVHEALRRSGSDFTKTTVNGLVYTSRYYNQHGQRPASASAAPTSSLPQRRKAHRNHPAFLIVQTDDGNGDDGEARQPPAAVVGDAGASAAMAVAAAASGGDKSTPTSKQRKSRTAKDEAAAKLEEASFIQRKRRCAKTFEDMIQARAQSNNSDEPDKMEQNMKKLIDSGIIGSILALCNVSDLATQSHCCRALYLLSRMPSARKIMVVAGAVASMKLLSRIPAAKSRQDLAAIACHLSEETGLVEALMHDGIDRSLARLITSSSGETKRICALAVFNISSDVVHVRQYVEPFAQLLISSTRATSVPTSSAASCYLIKALYNASLVPHFHFQLLSENIHRYLISQVTNVPDNVQTYALRALVSLCLMKPNRAQILSQGLCKLAEAMLKSESESIQEATLLLLLLLSVDEGHRIKLCHWVPTAEMVRAAERHVELWESGQANDHVYLASCLLRNLCDSVLTHHELVEEGAIAVLLRMSKLDNNDIKANAVCALCCIISSSPEEATAYVADVIEQLLHLSRTTQLHNCLFAVTALYNIACGDDSLPFLARSETLMTRMLELTIDPPSESVAKLVAAIVYRLSTFPNIQPKMLQRGFLPALIQLIKKYLVVQVHAVNALYLLAQYGGDSFPHGREEVAHLALALGEQHTERRSGHRGSTSQDQVTIRSAVTLLAHLVNHRLNQAILGTNSGVFRFLRNLRRYDDDDTILLNASFVYYCLTATYEGCELLLREDGMEELIYMSRISNLSTTNNLALKELCMLAICRISSFLGLESKLIEKGAVDAVLIMAMVATDSKLVKTLCIKTLANCLVAKTCTRSLIEHGVIWALSSLSSLDSQDTRHACAISLCNLSAVPHMLSRFLDAGAPRAMLHLLQHGDAATFPVTIKAIANMVANEKICAVFMNEDLERYLSKYFADPTSNEPLRQLVAMVLLRVASANDAVISRERLNNGVFLWMEQIIVMQEPTLVRNCMLTVHDLTCSSTIDVRELNVDHIVRIVIQVFQRHPGNTEIVSLCLWVLYNLSCQLSVLHFLVNVDVLKLLRTCVPDHGAKDACADGAPPTSSALNLDVKLTCLILHNASCTTSDDVLALLVNLHAVHILYEIFIERDDLKEICFLTTCNIALGKVNSTRLLEDCACDLFFEFVGSSYFRSMHHRLVAAALRKLINAPRNQHILIEAGLVKACVLILLLPDVDKHTSRDLLFTLLLLSKCAFHLPHLLRGGILTCVVQIADSKNTEPELLGICFEILSNVCTVNYEEVANAPSDINVIHTLTRLSEFSSDSAGGNPRSSTDQTFYARGEGKALPPSQLLTFMRRSPTTSMKKNLELQATYTVPTRKWIAEAQPVPALPPRLQCKEVQLTESSESIPLDIKQKLVALTPLTKEPLIRDETSDDGRAVSPPPHAAVETVMSSLSNAGANKKLHRGLAGRHLALSKIAALHAKKSY